MGAVIVMGLALLVAALAIVVLLRRGLTEDLKTSAGFRAAAVSEILAATPPAGTTIGVGDAEDEFVQVLAPDGTVVTSSENVVGEGALIDLLPGESERLEVPFEDETFLAVAFSTPSGQPAHTILVGHTLEEVAESSGLVARLLALGSPLLLALLGVVTWKVVGGALAPVESIRREVESITTQELHRRVPVSAPHDEIARLAATMNAMLERLEAGQERQRRFVSDASHELRSPVASIRQHAEVAKIHPGTASVEELAELVLEENARIQELVEDLLLLARLDERPAGARETIDLDDIVLESASRFEERDDRTIDQSGVSAARVLGDRKQLGRLVGNLLDNALRHARAAVRIELRESGDSVILRVDDDGTGVPPGERERIFTRFVRLQEARDRDTGGTGLGLAIVAEVAEAHGGRVRLLESPSGGARFEVELPRAAR